MRYSKPVSCGGGGMSLFQSLPSSNGSLLIAIRILHKIMPGGGSTELSTERKTNFIGNSLFFHHISFYSPKKNNAYVILTQFFEPMSPLTV
jgi:hypothetical protein